MSGSNISELKRILLGHYKQKESVIYRIPEYFKLNPERFDTELSSDINNYKKDDIETNTIYIQSILSIFCIESIDKALAVKIFIKTISQDILSLKSDNDYCGIWMNVIIIIIKYASVTQVNESMLPLFLLENHLNEPIHYRMISCRILPLCIQKNVPNYTMINKIMKPVRSLCQDIVREVRAYMSYEMMNIAGYVGVENTCTLILPELINHLINDDTVMVKSGALESIAAICHALPESYKRDTLWPELKIILNQRNSDLYIPIIKYIGWFFEGFKDILSIEELEDMALGYMNMIKLGSSNYMEKDGRKYSISLFYDVGENVDLIRLHVPFALDAIIRSIGPKQFVENYLDMIIFVYKDPNIRVKYELARNMHLIIQSLGEECLSLKEIVCSLLSHSIVKYAFVDSIDDIFCTFYKHLSRKNNQLVIENIMIDLLNSLIHKPKSKDSQMIPWRLQIKIYKSIGFFYRYFDSNTINKYLFIYILKKIETSREMPLIEALIISFWRLVRYGNLRNRIRFDIIQCLINKFAFKKSIHYAKIFITFADICLNQFSLHFFKQYIFPTCLQMLEDTRVAVHYELIKLLPKLIDIFIMPRDKFLIANFQFVIKKFLIYYKSERVNQCLINLNNLLQNKSNPEMNDAQKKSKIMEMEENLLFQSIHTLG
ncbi:Serine/threonine-protein phosphatase 4 regulatory subunit 4 [Intoshia linei]|uniref:Serine/threonine-protein phosphatase 4 regulatory subunit 4 n=1 Tax=Intoshia linei TaxID=1819745 RepID=A0A177B4Z4_9BILA|nr:Serine/threonine-protein phosphatase 4 regulatory subunit 4 [Intoshia linei]